MSSESDCKQRKRESSKTSSSGPNDKQLLEIFKNGDEESRNHVLQVFYERHAEEVYRLVRSQVTSDEMAEDICSRVWEIACRELPDFVWQGKPIKHWLFATARRIRLETQRRNSREVPLSSLKDIQVTAAINFLNRKLEDIDRPFSHAPPSSIVQFTADQYLANALNHLKVIERKIILLLYYKGKNSTEIGSLLNMTPAAVRQRHKRTLVKLRRQLKIKSEVIS